jgi:hypothetical protein
MVWQGEPSIDETKEEIAQETKAYVAQAARLAREANKAAGKRDTSHDTFRDSDEEVGDNAASEGTTAHRPTMLWPLGS